MSAEKGKSIFEGDLPRAVDFKTGIAIGGNQKGDYISFEPVKKPAEPTEKKPTKDTSDATATVDDDADEDETLDDFEKMLGGKIEEPVNAEVEEVDELEAKLQNAEVDETAENTIPINELFEAEWIVDGVDEVRTPAYMGIYEWRAEKTQIEKFFNYLSSLQSRSDEQQKQWQELDAWLKDFNTRYDSLEKKVAWSERHKDRLKKYVDFELAKLGDKRIPIGLYILGMEVVALTRVGIKSTKRDALSFELPDNIPDIKKTKPAEK